MRKKISLVVAMLAALGMLMVTAGCETGFGGGYRSGPGPEGPPPWAPAHGARAKHRYRYYSSAEVYFDTGRGLYFYLVGTSWQSSTRLPAFISIAGSYVELDMDTDLPYKFHNDVKHRYPPGQMKKMERGGPSGKDAGPDKGKPDKGKSKGKGKYEDRD